MKKFLICLSLLFSFCFIGNVKAVSLGGKELSEEFLTNNFYNTHNSNNTNIGDYPYITCRSVSTSTYSYDYLCTFSSEKPSYGKQSNTQYVINFNGSSKGFNYSYNNANYVALDWTATTYTSTSSSYSSAVPNWKVNYDIIVNGSTIVHQNISFIPNSSYNVNFHLNGGSIWDLSNMLHPVLYEEDYSISTEDYDLSDYMTHINPFKNYHTFIGWYYDSSFTQPYNSSDTVSSDIDLYAKWYEKPNINFHLNGGYIKDYSNPNIKINIEQRMCLLANCHQYDSWATNPYEIMLSDITEQKIDYFLLNHTTENNEQFKILGMKLVNKDYDDIEIITDDYEKLFETSDNVHEYIGNINILKETMQFGGWYYDVNFKNPYRMSDNIEGNTTLYAKWRYENVEDFLNITTFNNYTFDTNYKYAIITRGDNTGDIYLGLNVNKYDITVYQYDESINDYKNSQEYCLIPMYSKDNKYYYLLNGDTTNYINVLVLPKETFDNENYNFLLSENSYVTYTDNLEQSIIYDNNGNQINTNLEERYNTLQYSLVNDEKDLLTIFKNLLNFKDNRVLSNINTVWNKLKATPIYSYFMILIVGGLIILIIKSARRN